MESIWFSYEDSRDILEFIEQADRQNRDVRMGAIGIVDGELADSVVADFDVTGFIINFQRMPCS